jgi:hypothetical protein
MLGGGGVVSFVVKGGTRRARRFADALELIPIATSLGGVETIVELPYDLDFGTEDGDDRAAEARWGTIDACRSETCLTPGRPRSGTHLSLSVARDASLQRGQSLYWEDRDPSPDGSG